MFYTIASTFEKPRSLKFELLFGSHKKRVQLNYSENRVMNAFDYIFSSNEIFGFHYKSTGLDFKKFHHAFILRTCNKGEKGSTVPGISPGAEILVKATTKEKVKKLEMILDKLLSNKINLSKISIHEYKKLNYLFDINSDANYWVGEIIEQTRKI